MKLNEMVQDISTAVILQFIGTFAVWTLAEALHLSGIITIVVFAIVAARRSNTAARVRVASYAVWEEVVYVLNVLAFILVGLQLKPQLKSYLATAAAVLVAVVLVRLVWVMCHVVFSRWIGDPARRRPSYRPSGAIWRSAVVIGAGARGSQVASSRLPSLPLWSYRGPARVRLASSVCARPRPARVHAESPRARQCSCLSRLRDVSQRCTKVSH